jgi:ClpP class serine protease
MEGEKIEGPMRTPDGEIRWMVSLFESLYPDKVWVIPRSGATFQRRGDQLVHVGGDSYEALLDAIMTKQHFAQIGVEVVRA